MYLSWELFDLRPKRKKNWFESGSSLNGGGRCVCYSALPRPDFVASWTRLVSPTWEQNAVSTRHISTCYKVKSCIGIESVSWAAGYAPEGWKIRRERACQYKWLRTGQVRRVSNVIHYSGAYGEMCGVLPAIYAQLPLATHSCRWPTWYRRVESGRYKRSVRRQRK